MTNKDTIEWLMVVKDKFIPKDDDWYDEKYREAIDKAIIALEQDTVPFDFELYQAGLMDMPKGMIEVLDKIRAEITAISISGQVDEHTMFVRTAEQVKQMALDIIDKYKAEKE